MGGCSKLDTLLQKDVAEIKNKTTFLTVRLDIASKYPANFVNFSFKGSKQ
jgi:hypothetical protein